MCEVDISLEKKNNRLIISKCGNIIGKKEKRNIKKIPLRLAKLVLISLISSPSGDISVYFRSHDNPKWWVLPSPYSTLAIYTAGVPTGIVIFFQNS